MSRLSPFAAVLFAACGSGGDDLAAFEHSELSALVVEDFAWQTAVPTYDLLSTRLTELSLATNALMASPNATTLADAQQAWVEARRPWEQSEGFLFGPVDANGFDPALDSWPVNRTDLDAVLSGSDALTADFVSNLDPTVKGFHTAEYLLFGADSDQTADQLDDRELAYLALVTAEMVEVGDALATSWTADDGYADTVASAGAADNQVYPSRTAAAEEMVRGMIAILDEVANGKIADPYDERDPNLVESPFSRNSLADFADNLASVGNVYTCSVELAGTSGTGLGAWIAEVDPDLDARVRLEVQAAITAIGEIPAPFHEAVLDPEADDEIEAAQAAISTAMTTMQGEVLPLVLQ